jgi:hypothetical protein
MYRFALVCFGFSAINTTEYSSATVQDIYIFIFSYFKPEAYQLFNAISIKGLESLIQPIDMHSELKKLTL